MDRDAAHLAAALAGRYRIERELGHGGMAAVYLAHDLQHDRPVALKILQPEVAQRLGPQRFLREIRLAARLQHPHILTVLESGVVPPRHGVARRGVSRKQGVYWFTMPYVEGESLRDRLDREKQLSVEEALRIAHEVALGLDCAHRHGVIHRDIKPENILLTEDGSTLLADFGIARSLLPEASDERLTDTGVALGTPVYMSPEQAAGEHEVDARTDIYSLGVVLYEALAGEPPFSGPSPQAIIAQRFSGAVPRLRRVRSSVSEALDSAVARALAVVPADRWNDAAAFARALTPPARAIATAEARQPAQWERTALVIVALMAALAVAIGVHSISRDDRPATPPTAVRRLAVLPFENLGDSSDAYFADGITDAVRGELTSIPGLEVIASTSSRRYRRTDKSPRDVARELGVDYLLLGNVRWEKLADGTSRVRVSPELIEASTAAARWQGSLDASLTDVFQVQREIAAQVAQALDVALGDSTQRRLAERPTQNLAAYDAYLRGEAISNGLSAVDATTSDRAAIYYEQAASLDSGFGQAWARLSEARSSSYYAGVPKPAFAEEARRSAERALELIPDGPEGHLALGMYYSRVARDFTRAATEFAAGLKLSPNNADLLTLAGVNQEFQGKWDSALTHLQRAFALDPRSSGRARLLGYLLLRLRRYPEAEATLQRGLLLDSADLDLIEDRAMVELARGDLAGARAVIQAAPRSVDPGDLAAHFGTFWDLYWALDDDQQQLLLRLGPSSFGGNRGDWGIALAQTYWIRGKRERARAYADSARLAFEEQLGAAPEDAQLHALRGLALAYLGRGAEAVAEGKRAMSITPVSSDAYSGPYLVHVLVRIYLLGGQKDRALDTLEPLLKIPYYLSPGWLRVDPAFTTLQGNPRFEELLRG